MSEKMAEDQAAQERQCPGEKYSISLAICRTRQRNQYPKCMLCRHRDAELAGSSATDAKVSNAIFRSTMVLGRVPEQVNEYVMRKVGLAAAQYLRAENPAGSRLAVACDARENSRGFARIFCEGVNRSGCDTVNIGPVAPELLAYMLATGNCAGAAFISGWNYPETVNGIRIWRRDGRILGFGAGLEKVGLIARRLRMACSRLPGETEAANPLADYVGHALKFVPKFPSLRVVVDGGGGAAAPLLRAMFGKLPAELLPLNFGGDSAGRALGRSFPAAPAVSEVRKAVRESGADFGAALDFAGERVVFLDETGCVIRHDLATALIATEVLAQSPEATVTFDLRSSAAVRQRILACGGEPVSAPASRLEFTRHFRRCDAAYGGDLSGLHHFKSLARFAAPAVALLLFGSHLGRADRPASELVRELDTYSRSEEVTIPIPDGELARSIIERVRDAFQGSEREMIDGLTVRKQDWWFNLRQPGGASELRLIVEGRSRREERRGRQQVERLVQKAANEVES